MYDTQFFLYYMDLLYTYFFLIYLFENYVLKFAQLMWKLQFLYGVFSIFNFVKIMFLRTSVSYFVLLFWTISLL